VPIFGALFWGIAGGVASLMGVPLQLVGLKRFGCYVVKDYKKYFT
jgi:hypothetical protein